MSRTVLMDASGREVLSLKLGASDVRSLVLEVYFVREARAQAQVQSVKKVIIAR